MNVLVVDVGGTSVKVLATGRRRFRKFLSPPGMTPRQMVAAVQTITGYWKYDVVSIGYPGVVHRGRPAAEPWNLGGGWVGFDFQAAFNRPVNVINDAAMQAIGSYEGGKLLFLGLGTGLGSTLILDGIVQPMELGHLPYKSSTFEDYVGIRGLKTFGLRNWRRYVADVVSRLKDALQPDEVVLGGGNVFRLKTLPTGCRAGRNSNAFRGGFRLWEPPKNGARKELALGKAHRTDYKTPRETARMEGPRVALQKGARTSSPRSFRG